MPAHLLQFALTAGGSHVLASFLQSMLHRMTGHHRRGGWIHRAHLGIHHAVYRSVYASDRYLDEDASLTLFYLVPVAVCSAMAFWVLPPRLALTAVGTFLFSLLLHAQIHIQYHLTQSWLRRFRWFRRRQALHEVHHRLPNRNFGVLDFYWDRLFGTFTEPPPKAGP